MRKNIVIVVLGTLVVWLAAVVIRLENFHYASVVGMCPEWKADDPLQTVNAFFIRMPQEAHRACGIANCVRTPPLGWSRRFLFGLAGDLSV